jgi:hypothetical protein
VVGGCPVVIWCHKAAAPSLPQQGQGLWVGAAWVGAEQQVPAGKEQGGVGSRRRGSREEGMRQGLLVVAAVKEAGCSQA